MRLVIILAFVSLTWFATPGNAAAITCGFGSDIGGGQCRGYLTSGTSWTVPNDWSSGNNTVEAIGGGGSGYAGGGGGGAYAKVSNVPLTAGASVSYAIGSGGNGAYPGNPGGDTYFCRSTSNCGSISGTSVVVGAKGGQCGYNCTSTGAAIAQGGSAAASIGSTTYSGGNGGMWVFNTYMMSGAGGGAAGPNGSGATGGSGSASPGGAGGGGGNGGGSAGGTGTGSTGGAGGNNSGSGGSGSGATASAAAVAGSSGGGGGGGFGTGSFIAGKNGGAGTEFDASHGSGGGGGGSTYAGTAGSGALYGGGGGGSGSSDFLGSGAQGIIVITYTPVQSSSRDLTVNDAVSVSGSVIVVSNLSKGSGTFVIDHPLDPANKLLYHSFVESPDALNQYAGTALLDKHGEAVVRLPQYFEALNGNYQYFVRPIDAPMPALFVKDEVHNNAFAVSGGVAGGEISWMVTGVRRDPYILANPIIVEVDKGPDSLVDEGEYVFEGNAPHCDSVIGCVRYLFERILHRWCVNGQ